MAADKIHTAMDLKVPQCVVYYVLVDFGSFLRKLCCFSAASHHSEDWAQVLFIALTKGFLRSRRNATLDAAVVLCLQEAASLKDPFTAHMEAPDKEELVEIEKEMDGAFVSPRPDHERIEKLLTMQASDVLSQPASAARTLPHMVARIVVRPALAVRPAVGTARQQRRQSAAHFVLAPVSATSQNIAAWHNSKQLAALHLLF